MIENQDIEFKSKWEDKWLEWICGMANANGGIVYIGKDDKGKVIGVKDAKRLVKDIPNKIKDKMGIIPSVKVEKENGLEYITIKVEKYPVPISLDGILYLRSGSNNNKVTGAELDRLMLSKIGRTWDSIPIPNVKVEDLDQESIKRFKKLAVMNKRLSEKDVKVDDKTLLQNLHLMDGEYLTVAAVLLFHSDPEQWVTGAFVKIGFFENDNVNLRYQDEVHGSLIMQADKVTDFVYEKYLKALIDYQNQKRIDEYMFPKDRIS